MFDRGADQGSRAEGGTFAEDLPYDCPPSSAVECDERLAYRFLKSSPATMESFHSHAKLGKRKPKDVPECFWASCSLIDIDRKDILESRRKIPKFKNKPVAVIQLDCQSGMIKSSNSGHVDFWMYSSFNPLAAIKSVEGVDP
ncbi:MAG: hypothetical protein HQL64_14145 [Magnetococcales bacterium]|nr:hypothetical protein [Magnetococcales bacterium]